MQFSITRDFLSFFFLWLVLIRFGFIKGEISLSENSSKSDLKDLLSELELLKKLKPHPNVIRLLGCVTKDVIRCQGKREFSKFIPPTKR